MGVIYLAEDKYNGSQRCVVKQLISKPTSKEQQKEAVRLFKREAEILRALDHPGIVRVFDGYATRDGKYFLVMDYVPGKNLESILSQYGPFSSEATIEIGIQCCEVLEYLHGLDPPIIYRDLKPSNLMLTPDGKIIFIDFGIARSFMPQENATRVVTTGYSPPEQYFGRPELQSDLYALGATLGHLLTGVRPKPLLESTPKKIDRHVLSTLDGLIRRLTAHSPDDRPASAKQVRYELYGMYQEIHPEFSGVDDGLAPQAMPTSQSAREMANEYSRRQCITAHRLQASTKDRFENPTNLAVNQQEGRDSLWKQLKNWLDDHFQ